MKHRKYPTCTCGAEWGEAYEKDNVLVFPCTKCESKLCYVIKHAKYEPHIEKTPLNKSGGWVEWAAKRGFGICCTGQGSLTVVAPKEMEQNILNHLKRGAFVPSPTSAEKIQETINAVSDRSSWPPKEEI